MTFHRPRRFHPSPRHPSDLRRGDRGRHPRRRRSCCRTRYPRSSRSWRCPPGERCDYPSVTSLVVYDDLKPTAWADVSQEVPLLVDGMPRDPSVGLADRGHHAANVRSKLWVSFEDVLPSFLAQADASSIWIGCRREHLSMLCSASCLHK